MKIYTNKNATTEVVSKFDADENPTKFKIGLLTTTERELINEQISVITESSAHKVIRSVVELGLRGWEGLKDENDQPVQFKTIKKQVLGLPEREVIHPELYDLPQMFDLWNDLAEKIRKFNSLTEKQTKN
jgi:hypothetical protein